MKSLFSGLNRLIWLTLPSLVLLALASPAPLARGSDQAIVRRVLAVYDSRVSPDLAASDLHRAVQMVLEHLGLVVDFIDASQGDWPDEESMADYRGIVSQLLRPDLPAADKYLNWLIRQIQAGRKVVLLDRLGPVKDALSGEPVSEETLQKYWAAVGLEDRKNWSNNPTLLEYVYKDQDLTEYERKYPLKPPEYFGFRSLDPRIRALVTIRRTDLEGSESPVVCLTPAGGFAHEPYLLYHRPDSIFLQWHLDPFAFFEAALDLAGLPRLDATTISGRRLFYAHIDGDALISTSHIERNRTCGQIIRDEVLKAYDLPFTVSVITAQVDPEALGKPETIELVRSIFALPNVEPASHTFSHPFHWQKAIDSAKGEPVKDSGELPYGHYLDIPGYQFNLNKEIEGSVRFIDQNLAPPGKKCAVLQWSGDCRPPKEAIALVDELGLANINGGDTVCDAINPSLARVSPLVRPVGDRIQVYTSASNENIYTNLWSGPFWGFRRAVQTYERTESPLRLRPLNVYFHFYSGERQASLNALKHCLDFALSQPLSPVYTSHYFRIVKGFLRARLAKTKDGGFRVSDYGAARTLRFDQTEERVDLKRSVNVQGFKAYQGSLYVHLGPGQAVVYLTPAKSQRPYLVEASGLIEEWSSSPEGLSFRYAGWGQGEVVIGGLEPEGEVEIRMGKPSGGEALDPAARRRADSQGRLILSGIKAGQTLALAVE